MDHLQALLNSTNKPLGSCGLTMKSKSSFNISGSIPQSIWIFNFGATDHMTPFPSYFTSYLNLLKKQFITVANGDHVPIVPSNFSPLYPYTILELFSNIFSFSLCYFQELTTGMIGIGNNTNKEDLPSNQQTTSETFVAYQIWLYHKRLRHPLFRLLKTTFPHLFTKESIKSFKCDACQFSKYHRATFFFS
ncbi:hypothetical protein CR513_40619, partial [Mucuna pruriens]